MKVRNLTIIAITALAGTAFADNPVAHEPAHWAPDPAPAYAHAPNLKPSAPVGLPGIWTPLTRWQSTPNPQSWNDLHGAWADHPVPFEQPEAPQARPIGPIDSNWTEKEPGVKTPDFQEDNPAGVPSVQPDTSG